MTDYQRQVDTKHYSFKGYFHKFRWMSYWYQLKEIVDRPDITSQLDIGPGSLFLKKTLEVHRPDLKYTSMDIDSNLGSDVVGSVTSIPFPDQSFDLVSAFQVLEHIKFEDFETALKEMERVSKRYVFISLPHNVPSFDFQFKLPGIKRFSLAIKIPFGQKHVFNGQHYWEVGKRGYSAKRILSILTRHFEVITEYVPFENQYHHFYILKKRV
ncbi:MAG: methyltransferase domain-containing protein [Patescibacteria group bacterium]